MHWTSITSSIIAGAGVLAEALLDLALQQVRESLAPPGDAARWLRSRGARLALQRSLLQALADTASHTDLDELPFFDTVFLGSGYIVTD